MKLSDFIALLQERLQDCGDLDVTIQSSIDGDLREIVFDDQIAIRRTLEGKTVLALSPDGDWIGWNRYQAN